MVWPCLIATITACDKDEKISPPTPTSRSCVIKSESFTSGGSSDKRTFEYDYAGNLAVMQDFNEFDQVVRTTEMFPLYVATIEVGVFKPTKIATDYDSDYMNGSPVHGRTSFTFDGVTKTDHFIHYFTYDTQGRLITVEYVTPHVLNDNESKLTIQYANDNVSRLRYELTTGARDEIVVIDVEGYDDKATPYNAIKGWKYIKNLSAWQGSPEFITSLSKNNPLKIKFYNKGTLTSEITHTYLYNDKGYPIQCNTVNKIGNNEGAWVTTYEYVCQ